MDGDITTSKSWENLKSDHPSSSYLNSKPKDTNSPIWIIKFTNES